jgi:nitroreductase
MEVKQAITTRRTIRKFQQKPIETKILTELVDGARLAPSASNMQPLVYLVIHEPELCKDIFQTVRWAGYIAPEGDPGAGEKPTAYIVVLANKEIKESGYEHDAGAAIQNICLLAWDYGIGSCWIGSVDKQALRAACNIPDRYAIDSVVALGYAAERSVAEDEHGSIRYYKDEQHVLHVPKRKLPDILFFNRFD